MLDLLFFPACCPFLLSGWRPQDGTAVLSSNSRLTKIPQPFSRPPRVDKSYPITGFASQRLSHVSPSIITVLPGHSTVCQARCLDGSDIFRIALPLPSNSLDAARTTSPIRSRSWNHPVSLGFGGLKARRHCDAVVCSASPAAASSAGSGSSKIPKIQTSKSKKAAKKGSSQSGVKSGKKKARTSVDDPVAELLREVPNRVEPRVLVDGQLLTAQEAQERAMPVVAKILATAARVINSTASEASIQLSRKLGADPIIEVDDLAASVAAESREAASPVVTVDDADKAEIVGAGGVRDGIAKGVYLKDLLREYKGELFVPEEAFREQITETRAFEEALRAVPEMSPQDFVRMAGSGQIKTVTTRCVGLCGRRVEWLLGDTRGPQAGAWGAEASQKQMVGDGSNTRH